MTDDYFGTSATPPAGTPPGWAAPAPPYPSQSAPAAVTVAQPTLVAAGLIAAGLLMCLGAWAPWLHANAFGTNVDYGGLHAGLEGSWALALGFVALVLGVLLLTLPAGIEARRFVAGAAVLVGVVGLVVVVHQYVVLSDRLADVNQVLSAYLHIHVGSGWGLWLTGFGCVGVSGAGAAAFLV